MTRQAIISRFVAQRCRANLEYPLCLLGNGLFYGSIRILDHKNNR